MVLRDSSPRMHGVALPKHDWRSLATPVFGHVRLYRDADITVAAGSVRVKQNRFTLDMRGAERYRQRRSAVHLQGEEAAAPGAEAGPAAGSFPFLPRQE
jgi:hypothetical protein